MNEFLQSLRNNKNKPYNRSRRPYDGNQYNPSDKRSGNDRRTRPHRQHTDYDKKGSGSSPSPDDDLKALKPLLESLVANQQKRASIDERRAAAEERKAEALEGIVVYLKHLVGPDAPELERMVQPFKAKNEIVAPVEAMEEPFEAAEESFETAEESFETAEGAFETAEEEIVQAQPSEVTREAAHYEEEKKITPAPPEQSPEDDSMTVEEYLMMSISGGNVEADKEVDEEELPEEELAPSKLVLEAEPDKKARSKKAAPAAEVEAAGPEEDDVERVDIMGIIREMRGEGKTYGQIAEYLAGRNLPTFSGRGKWHAQTVHRLCQKR